MSAPTPAFLSMRCICGRRRGQHRWHDDACPDPFWRPGNGRPQWETLRSFIPARDAPTEKPSPVRPP